MPELKVGYIGLGRMGLAISYRLLMAGFHGENRTCRMGIQGCHILAPLPRGPSEGSGRIKWGNPGVGGREFDIAEV